jgi:transposase
MAKHRTHSIDFKRQVAQEFLAGETLHGLSKRHDISRNLIRVRVQKYQAGALDDDVEAADLLQQYEPRIAALERLVGKQALELEFLKGAQKSAPRPRSGSTSVHHSSPKSCPVDQLRLCGHRRRFDGHHLVACGCHPRNRLVGAWSRLARREQEMMKVGQFR